MQKALTQRLKMYAAMSAVLFLLAGCGPSPLLVMATIPSGVATGRVVSINTGRPIANALVVATTPAGGFWTSTTTYHLGSATTNAEGVFEIRIKEKAVANLARKDSPVTFNAFHKLYNTNNSRDLPFSEIQNGQKKPVILRISENHEFPPPDCERLRVDRESCKLISAVYQ